MYKLNNKFYGIIKLFLLFFKWLPRKLFLIITAFMLGMSNVILEEDRTLNDTQPKTEQEQKSVNEDDTLS